MCELQTSYPVFKTSWTDNNYNFQECVCFRFEDEDGNTRVTSEHPPRCLKLQSTSEACFIQVSSPQQTPGAQISAVDVVCDARRMEVFDDTDEYLSTVTGEMVDLEGYDKVYMLSHSFHPPVKAFKTRLVSLVNTSCVTVYGYHVTLMSQPASPAVVPGTVDLAKVQNLLADIGGQLPQGATNIMAAMDSAQKGRQASLGPLQAALSTLMTGVWPGSQDNTPIPGPTTPTSRPPDRSQAGSTGPNQLQNNSNPSEAINMNAMIHMLSSLNTPAAQDAARFSPGAGAAAADSSPLMAMYAALARPQPSNPSANPNGMDSRHTSHTETTAQQSQHCRCDGTNGNQNGASENIPSESSPSSSSDNGMFTSPQNNPGFLMISTYIDQRIQTLLRESEQRICSVLTDKIEQSERRILAAIQGNKIEDESSSSCYIQPECD